jgi:hypothetical protein
MFECPYCICRFESEKDLQNHLLAFPGNRSEHLSAMRRAHSVPYSNRFEKSIRDSDSIQGREARVL